MCPTPPRLSIRSTRHFTRAIAIFRWDIKSDGTLSAATRNGVTNMMDSASSSWSLRICASGTSSLGTPDGVMR